jgi:hypothetical protein
MHVTKALPNLIHQAARNQRRRIRFAVIDVIVITVHINSILCKPNEIKCQRKFEKNDTRHPHWKTVAIAAYQDAHFDTVHAINKKT